MTSISHLPDEVIVNIMSYLYLADRKSARLVSRRWCELSYASSLIKDDVTVVRNALDLDQLNYERKYFNIRIKNGMEDFTEVNKFWQNCGSHIKSLEIYLIQVTSQWLQRVVAFTPNLEYLLLSAKSKRGSLMKTSKRCLTLPPSDLQWDFPKLLSLDLLYMNKLSEEQFTNLVKNAPTLKRLSLEWCRCRIFNVVKEWTIKQGPMLKELNFSRTLIDNDFLRSIAPHFGLQMTGLYLQKCTQISGDVLVLIQKHLPNLKEIDLSMANVTDAELHELFLHWRRLTHISVYKTLIACSAPPLFATMPQLVAVELSMCSFIPLPSLMIAFGTQDLPKLMDLRLDKLKITDDFIVEMVKHLPNLRSISLNHCTHLTSKAIDLLATGCSKLRFLSLQDCHKITEITRVNDLKGLVHLDLYGCKKVNNDSIVLLQLLELQSIDLSGTGVDGSGCEALATNCPSLQDVYLDLEMQAVLKHVRKNREVRFKTHFGFANFTAESIFDY